MLSSSPPVDGPVESGGAELYLDVMLNGVATGQLVRFVEQRNVLYASAATLRELGLKWPGDQVVNDLIALDRLPGLQATYDKPRQRIALVVPVDLLNRPTLNIDSGSISRPQLDPTTRVPGLLLNYDLYAQHGSGQSSLNGATELRLFGVGSGIFSNTMTSRLDLNSLSGEQRRNVRLDTFWQHDFADDMKTLTAGDTTTGALSWSRALRIGGVRLSRNFALQPYRVTSPLASFQGSAVLPSTVDLFINGLKQSTQQVQPGQFQLNSVPSLNGSGQAQVVMTDINGQSRVISFALYGAPQLLQAGLSDWSLDLGTVRRDYGVRSFSYDSRPVLSASTRYGWSTQTTLEAHAEATSGLQLAGVGGVWLLGEQAGVLNASLAASQHGSAGAQWGLGYQWSSRQFNVSLNTLRADARYRDVASLNDSVVNRVSESAYAGFNTAWGQFGGSLIRQKYTDRDPATFASLSWSRQFAQGSNLNVSLSRSLNNDRGVSLYIAWSMPLERAVSVTASMQNSRHANSLTLDATRSTPSDKGGWGWRTQASLADNTIGQAQVSQLGRYGQWTAGISHIGGAQGASSSNTAYGSASGGLVWMEGGMQAMRRVDDAFALVSTSGVAGVPVRLENRLIGETDDRGLLFVSRLNAYQRNLLAIDPLRLPPDMRISRTTLDAVPVSRSGMLASFEMHRILAVRLALRDAKGEWLPAGSSVSLETPASSAAPAQTRAVSTQVGYDGLVYLEDPAPGSVLHVTTDEGNCSTPLSALSSSSGLVDLGILICH